MRPNRVACLTTVRRVWRCLVIALVAFVLLSSLAVILYGAIVPPVTPLMVIRWVEGDRASRQWAPYRRISPELVVAVMASEDARFCRHFGIDWQAAREAWHKNQRSSQLYGASTITMQTARNLFLWPSRSWLRKGVEVYFTVLLELFLDKRRIMELYLNVIEWGRGIYGAETAARAYFGKSAAELTRREAALLAAVLPDPRRWSPAAPTAYIVRRAAIIQGRMRVMDEDAARLCR